jgi:hypothetical protein
MPSEVEAIARGLSKAQKAVLLAAEEGWRVPSAKGLGSYRWQGIYNTRDKGLIELAPDLFRLSPLGRDVRAFLQAADQGKP